MNRIIFCPVCSMAHYSGAEEGINFRGKQVDLQEVAGEVYNFCPHDNRYYGYSARANQALTLSEAKTDTVIMYTHNKVDTPVIVGWYNNAQVYSKLQERITFTNRSFNLSYYFSADLEDCVLLPVESRTFDLSGVLAQTESSAKVVAYISEYRGERANHFLTDRLAAACAEGGDFDSNLAQGDKALENGYVVTAIEHYNAALKINKAPQVLFALGECFRTLNSFSRAIPMYEGCIELEGDTLAYVMSLASMHDMLGEREKTLDYLERSVPLIEVCDTEKEVDLAKIVFVRAYAVSANIGKTERAVRIGESILASSAAEETKKDIRTALQSLVRGKAQQ